MWLVFPVAVAVVQARSCSSDLTPSLGTFIRNRRGPKKKKKKVRQIGRVGSGQAAHKGIFSCGRNSILLFS